MIYGKRDLFVFHHDIGSLTPQQKASALLNLRYLMTRDIFFLYVNSYVLDAPFFLSFRVRCTWKVFVLLIETIIVFQIIVMLLSLCFVFIVKVHHCDDKGECALLFNFSLSLFEEPIG